MKTKIYPCFWYDGNAREAADFYCSVFENSKVISDSPMVVTFHLEGQRFMGLNGGSQFRFTPGISMFYTGITEAEISALWNKLADGGTPMMELGSYPWSPCYGWMKDKFGLTWQLMTGEMAPGVDKIAPCLLFTNGKFGRAEACIDFYTAVFPESSVINIQRYENNEQQAEGKLKHGLFTIQNTVFMAMDGPGEHHINFNEAVSLVVECANQEEIDFYWEKLSDGGMEQSCGWLKDQFGVSWQVVPTILEKLVNDPVKGPRVVQAFLKMRKFDIEQLLSA